MTFALSLEQHGESTALILEDGSTLSYTQLAEEADQTFAAPGAPQAERSLIAIECSNGLASIAGYLGALRRGFPALLIDAGLPQDLRDNLYSRFHIGHILDADGAWRETGQPAPAIHPELALLLSTSGSTGSPKLVRLTANNLQQNALAIAEYLQLDATERPITTLPMHYSYGLSVINSHLCAGATILLTAEPVTSRSFWEFFREQRASSLAGVPTLYKLLRQLRFERMELPSLTTLTQAGGAMDPEQIKLFAELTASRHQRFYVMYGQTEATARMAYVPPEMLAAKAGSIGIAIPGGALALIDDNGAEIDQPQQVGELQYRGPNVMMGYAESSEDLALPDVQNGVLLTGDLARRDEDGYFYIVGRRKRFIKLLGNRVNLDEVEQQLVAEGYDVAVTGSDDMLLVALRGAMEPAELATLISKRYRFHRSVIRVVAVDSFPLSAAGKIQYATLLEQAAK